jgi:hypothetical protein
VVAKGTTVVTTLHNCNSFNVVDKSGRQQRFCKWRTITTAAKDAETNILGMAGINLGFALETGSSEGAGRILRKVWEDAKDGDSRVLAPHSASLGYGSSISSVFRRKSWVIRNRKDTASQRNSKPPGARYRAGELGIV